MFIWSYMFDWLTEIRLHYLIFIDCRVFGFCLQFAIYNKSSSARPHSLISVNDRVFSWERQSHLCLSGHDSRLAEERLVAENSRLQHLLKQSEFLGTTSHFEQISRQSFI